MLQIATVPLELRTCPKILSRWRTKFFARGVIMEAALSGWPQLGDSARSGLSGHCPGRHADVRRSDLEQEAKQIKRLVFGQALSSTLAICRGDSLRNRGLALRARFR